MKKSIIKFKFKRLNKAQIKTVFKAANPTDKLSAKRMWQIQDYIDRLEAKLLAGDRKVARIQAAFEKEREVYRRDIADMRRLVQESAHEVQKSDNALKSITRTYKIYQDAAAHLCKDFLNEVENGVIYVGE